MAAKNGLADLPWVIASMAEVIRASDNGAARNRFQFTAPLG